MLRAAAAALLLPVTWAYSTSTRYCREAETQLEWPESDLYSDCPTESEWLEADECQYDSGAKLCKCPLGSMPAGNFSQCVIDEVLTSYRSGRCEDVLVRVTGSGQEEVYCRGMVENTKWAPFTRDGSIPRTFDCGWFDWGCWGDYWSCWWDGRFVGDKCYDAQKYIGESCSDELNCKGADESYDEYSTSCFDKVCTMYALAAGYQRTQCECDWIGVNILFACESDDTCNGHACVLTTQNGNKYCDYATEQGVLNWFR